MQSLPQGANPNQHIDRYAWLHAEQHAETAYRMIRQVASLVAPIMKQYGWHIRLLQEFVPEEDRLLGMNYGAGETVCLRLRHSHNRNHFFELYFVVDTMLHELCHIWHEHHSDNFYALWETLRNQFEEMTNGDFGKVMSKTSGWKTRQQARDAVQQETSTMQQGGIRLGGMPKDPNMSTREAAELAAITRASVEERCGNSRRNKKEIINRATSGIKEASAPALEDETVTQEALWEVMKSQEAKKAGLSRPYADRARGAWVVPKRRGNAPPPGTVPVALPVRGLPEEQTPALTTQANIKLPEGPDGKLLVNKMPPWYCECCGRKVTFRSIFCLKCGERRPDWKTNPDVQRMWREWDRDEEGRPKPGADTTKPKRKQKTKGSSDKHYVPEDMRDPSDFISDHAIPRSPREAHGVPEHPQASMQTNFRRQLVQPQHTDTEWQCGRCTEMNEYKWSACMWCGGARDLNFR